MSLKLCVLASGSSGNCTLIQYGSSSILIDAGLSVKEIARRLEAVGWGLDQVSGICVSHEHSDHVLGLGQIHQRHAIPVYTNRGTSEGLRRSEALAGMPCRIFETGQAFEVGVFRVEPFSVPHDAYEPVGFIVSVDGVRIGVVTDMGVATTLIRANLKSCRAVVVESNHDEKMLRDSRRPEYLKQRILGRQGHLSNKAAADLLAEIAGPDLDAAFLAHLSEDCNRGEIALKAASQSLAAAGHHHVKVHLTYPDKVSEIWSPAPR
jgi:phosphoribosyl 1,2-cyclic phosphodiesterase